ncbi:HAD family hydrolase [Gracilibacillus lacisalsi]|uniref:HAD family hydrolase n=1 Tax=Gracilibacillus lacisalsi TaxID=393087 RepID=UPI0003781F67|nr:HAD family hydrolase [Gracilibacillus lacisalsi]
MDDIKAIIFDKDGTLMKFHNIWNKSIHELLLHISNRYTDSEELYGHFSKAIGFNGGQVEATGILAGGTTKDITHALNQVIQLYLPMETPKVVYSWVSNYINQQTQKYIHEVQPTTDQLPQLLDRMKARNIIIGIATADDYTTTNLCLDALHLSHSFELLVTSDRFPVQKPDPKIIDHFCELYQLRPSQVAVVGDTPVDLALAKNASAGLAIGVLSGASNQKDLQGMADIIIPTIGEMIDNNNKFIWEEKKR